MKSPEAGKEFSNRVLELDRLLTQIGRKTRVRRGQFVQHRLSPPHFMLLRSLEIKGPMKSSDIAEELRVSRGAISNLTDRLFREGFVRRVRSQTDRRVVQIELTDEGQEYLRQKERERINWLSAVFQQLERDDLDDLIRICRRILDVIDSDALNQADTKEQGG